MMKNNHLPEGWKVLWETEIEMVGGPHEPRIPAVLRCVSPPGYVILRPKNPNF